MRSLVVIVQNILFAFRRLWNNRTLMLCLLTGLIAAVALLSSIPMYSDAVNNRLLQGELTEQGTSLPPFAFVYRYIGAWNGDVDSAELAPIDTYLQEQSAAIINLPREREIRHISTVKLRLFPNPDSQTFVSDEPLLFTNVGYVTELWDEIELLEGAAPADDALASGDTIPVVISHSLADQLGLQVGELYIVFGQGSSGVRLPVQVVGVWRAKDANSPFWFYQPEAFDDMLLTSELAFNTLVMPELDKPISQAVWYHLYDGGLVRPNDVPALLERISTVETRVNALLDGATLDTSPLPALQNYGDQARLLTVLLTIFAIPIVGLILYFVSLIAGMVVQRGQNEIALLRSRGTTRGQIIFIYLLEGLLIGVPGLLLGLLAGRELARIMSRSRTFLQLDVAAEALPVLISTNAVQYGLVAVTLCLVALLIPALFSSRFTIVSFKAQRARSLTRPAWQRYFLDVLLLVPPLYGWYLLSQQGTISFGGGGDLFSNPLLFLVPALFCFALSLIFIRFFPLIVGSLAWLSARLPGITGLLTLRQLARSAAQYTGPLVLIALTLSLATFTASMALTLDDHLIDQIYYATGADLNLAELGENTEEAEQSNLPGQAPPEDTNEEDENEPRFLFLPVEEHLAIDNVEAAARVGDYDATSNIGGRQTSGRLLGIDRVDLPNVAYFRSDFSANDSLGGLMNRLGAGRNNVLVSRDFLARRNLNVGDPIRLTVEAAGDFADIELRVAGALDLFPTWYPDQGPLFVANLDYIHEGLGGQYPYNVWLEIDELASADAIVQDVRELGIIVVTAQEAAELIAEEQGRPERQGVFGLLSVGFFAAAALTVLGFLVYAVVSFQRRFVELGMLRALGLSVTQMAGYLAAEQAILIAMGMGLGTAIGVVASGLFIPYLQIGTGSAARIPPFVVQIAWEQLISIYAVFGVMFVVAVLVLIVQLLRMRLFEAVKLGETI